MSNYSNDGIRRWICPSDRELTLRAKLSSGWSFRTNSPNSAQTLNSPSINESEQVVIAKVLERARKLREHDEQRVCQLNKKLAKIREQARGDGAKTCILCSDQPKFFSRFYTCKDCRSAVCNKCVVDIKELNQAKLVWLCKICFESRELIKKSNQWTLMCNNAK